MAEAGARPILVTGSSGFIGANLVHALAARGDTVVAIEGPSGHGWRAPALQGATLLRVDLTHEDDVRAMMREVQPSVVFNCAAYGAYSVQTLAAQIYAVNLQAVRYLLEASHDVPGFRAFVQAGSSSEYGFNCRAPNEDAPTLPDSEYAVSKIGASALVRFHGKKYQLPAWSMRLYSVYGPYEDFSRLIPTLLLHAREGRLPSLVNPDISRDFVYVDDITRAFQVIANRAPSLTPGEIFNIGTGRRTTLADLVGLARGAFGVAIEPEWGSMPDRRWDHGDWYADPRKAAAELDWRATTSLNDGLLATMKWLDANPGIVNEGRAQSVTTVRR